MNKIENVPQVNSHKKSAQECARIDANRIVGEGD